MLTRWPFSVDAHASRFTTVVSWKADVSLPMIDGIRHSGKNAEFSCVAELPQRTRIPMEIAISDAAPLDHLRAPGRHVASARATSATMARSGRTAVSLAPSKPVLVQLADFDLT